MPRLGPNAPRPSPGFTPVGVPPPPRVLGPSRAPGPSLGPAAQPQVPRLGPTTTFPTRPRGGFVQPGPPQAFVPEQIRSGEASLAERAEFVAQNPWARDPSVMGQIAQQYERPSQALGALFRVLRVGENVGVGTVKAVAEGVSNAIHFRKPGFGTTSKDILELLPPWAFYSNVPQEVTSAIREDMTYEDWLKESHDPDSFLYRHSMVIGLGLSLVGDPTTYLTFGAGGVAKTAATQTFSAAWMRNADQALKLSRLPANAGRPLNSIMEEVGRKNGSPFSIEEALEQMRRGHRAGEAGRYRQIFPRGGQGMRFMGLEVPGTRALGQKVGGKIRAPGIRAMQHFIPDSKVHTVTEDILRTTFLHEMTRELQAGAQIHKRAQESALMMFAQDKPLARQLLASPSTIKRGELVVRQLFDEKRVPFVPQDVRGGLLKPDWTPNQAAEGYGERLANLKKSANMARGKVLKRARDVGYDDAAVKDFERQWDTLVERYSDPIEVVSRFQGHVYAKIHNQEAMDRLLKNPLFARIDTSAARGAMDKAAEELDEMAMRLSDAKRAQKVAKTSQQKATAASRVKNWKDKHAVAKAVYQTAKETVELEAAGGRVISPGERMGRDWESAMPFTHRGVKYMVPEPLHEAMTQMRNPAYIDKELERWYNMVNWTSTKWKLLATAPNPQFHAMNAVGGMWNNMLAGVYNPFDHLATYADHQRLKAMQSGRKGVIQRLPHLPQAAARVGFRPGRFTGPLRNAEQVAAEFEAGGVRGVEGGFVPEELARGEYKRLAGGKASGKRRAFTAARRTVGAAGVASIATLVAPDEWVPDDLEDLAERGAIGAALLAPEILQTGKAVARDVEIANRFTPYRQYARDRGTRQLIEAHSIAPPTEFGKWIGQTDLKNVDMVQETMYDIGAAIALRYQFDYSKLTTVERNWAKMLFPFYTFYKNNFVLQVQEAVYRPRVLSIFDKAREATSNYAESLMGEDDPANNPWFKDMLPEYFDKLTMFQVPVPNKVRDVLGLPHDQPLFLNPKLPFATLNMFPPVWELMNDKSVTPTPQKWAQVFSPLFGSVGPWSPPFPGAKILLESVTGYNLGLAKPIDYQRMQSGGWRSAQTEAPTWARLLPDPLRGWLGIYRSPETGQLKTSATKRYVLDQLASPFLNGLGEPIAMVGGEASEKSAANTVAWLTGIRLTPVDPIKIERGWLYRMENFLEGRRAELKERGTEPPLEDQAFLREIRAHLKVVEAAWDAKQENLYGQP